jgi:Holliday junction resolvase RusA-like endonuclease
MILEIFIPRVAAWLTTNGRDHWAVKNAGTKTWRRSTWALTKGTRPIQGPVKITATIIKPTRHRYDLDGHVPTVKACIDGLRDAGVITEDHTGVVPELTLRAGEPARRAGVLLRIESITTKETNDD